MSCSDFVYMTLEHYLHHNFRLISNVPFAKVGKLKAIINTKLGKK